MSTPPADPPAGLPWPAGAATGIGSLPGTDFDEALRLTFGELPDLPYLPELPDRGPGADLVGRGASLLVELPVELYAGRWQLTARPGMDARHAADLRQRDLDRLTEQAASYAGPMKIQAAGPWTLAAALQLPRGGPPLRDPGAVRDLVDSLADGLRRHLAEVASRVPGARLLLQLDEPSLPTVLAGGVPTESGLFRLPVIEPATAQQALHTVIAAAAAPVVVHCCAPQVPLHLLRDAGAVAVALDLDQLTELDPLAEALDAGLGLLAGAHPTQAPEPRSAAELADRLRSLWRDLALPAQHLPGQLVVTPACGLAGATPQYARAALAACREAARRLAGG